MATKMVCVLVPVMVIGLASGARGETYYVNGDCGSNAWTGTSSVCAAPDGPKRTIQAGIDAAVSGDEVIVADGVYTGSGNKELDFEGRIIAVRSANGPETCIIDCEGFGRGFALHSDETAESAIDGFTITNGSSGVGGGMILSYADTTVSNCVFTNNTADICGAVRHDGLVEMTFANCTFSGNGAVVGAGAIGSFGPGRLNVVDCVFTDNEADAVAGLATTHNELVVTNCLFARNIAPSFAGALSDASEQATFINCVLSRNAAGFSGGGEMGSVELLFFNSTIGGNPGGGIGCYTTTPVFQNCVLWGNGPSQFDVYDATVSYSDVEGGWPGVGNIDADPLFVQPGTDNLRLSIGSPCVNAGDNTAIPPGITTDIDGNPRIQGGVVDMGAYEGEFDAEAAADGESDFDNGEFIILIPNGDNLDPLETAAVLVVNTSGPDDATFVVTEYGGDVYPGAAGYSEVSCILSLDTTLGDGEYLATLFIPFDAAGMGPVDPAQVNLTRYDPDMGNWSLVVTGNASNSPGYDGPVGDRVLRLEGGDWGVTNEIGDYGVYWDPSLQQGFAWAHVDVAQDFGLGMALCPADCLQTPDGEVSIVDFLALLRRWGESSVGSPCDIDGDGVIGQEDVLDLLEVWGPCPPQPMPAVRPDRPGKVVGHTGVAVLRASWGPCEGCEADLNGDGQVDIRDLLRLLADWKPDVGQSL
ncbi:MAG: choice-of-anchor Q domain-containing protein [Planctomycetota bacterium]|jgi:hypothetical protein